MDRFTQLCLWTDESVALCRELQELFGRERSALLTFRGDELAEITMCKERAVSRVVALRRKIGESVKAWCDLENQLLPEQVPAWQQKQGQWQAEWTQIRKQAERSQFFLKHSQKNLGSLIENWRRLLGESPLYSAKGTKVDASTTGKVFEAKV
jgi:hypothetical protein